jgi:hypothetical protein
MPTEWMNTTKTLDKRLREPDRAQTNIDDRDGVFAIPISL